MILSKSDFEIWGLLGRIEGSLKSFYELKIIDEEKALDQIRSEIEKFHLLRDAENG